jgi:hypothetical protein
VRGVAAGWFSPPQTVFSQVLKISKEKKGKKFMENPSDKPPFSAIFDFSFSEFISIDLIRVLYVFAFIVAGLTMVGTIFAGFSYSFWWGLGSLIMAPIVFFVIIFAARISLETMIVLFKIAEHTKATAENTKED